MKLHAIGYIIIIALIISCRNNPNHTRLHTLISTDTIAKIKLDSDSRNLSFVTQYFRCHDTDFVATLNERFNRIEVFNLKTNSIYKKIDIKVEGPNAFGGVTSFIINNMDSIIIICTWPKMIGIINSKGNILKKIPFERDSSGRIVMDSQTTGKYRPYKIGNKIFLCQRYTANESAGILNATSRNLTFLTVIVDLVTGECCTAPIVYPEELVGKDISDCDVTRTVGYKNEFIYHFGSLEKLFRTRDLKAFEVKELQTNYKLNLYQSQYKRYASIDDYLDYKYSFDGITNLYYDKYNECYYLLIREKRINNDVKKMDKVLDGVYPFCFIIILDKDLNYIGETHFPENIYSFQMLFITQEGVYISEDNYKNPSFSEDFMSFRLFKFEKF